VSDQRVEVRLLSGSTGRSSRSADGYDCPDACCCVGLFIGADPPNAGGARGPAARVPCAEASVGEDVYRYRYA